MNVFKHRKDSKDNSLYPADNAFIDIKPLDARWWLQSDVDVEWSGKLASRVKFKAQHIRAHSFRHYVDLVTDGRKSSELSNQYEQLARDNRSSPWSGSFVERVVESARQIRDKDTSGGGKLPLNFKHVSEALQNIKLDQDQSVDTASGLSRSGTKRSLSSRAGVDLQKGSVKRRKA